MQFQTLSRNGKAIDSGTLPRAQDPERPTESKPTSR
jgi:hypothetical protein